MGRVNGHTAEEVIEAIKKNNGFLAPAARDLGIARSTIFRYVSRYPTIKQAVDDLRDENIDFAEHQLMKAIKNGSIPAIMFFLKTVGRNRGYVERQEVEGNLTHTVIVNWDEPKSTD